MTIRRIQPVTFGFAGDVHFEGVLRGKLDTNPASVLAAAAPLLRRADIAVVNLETAITTRGTPQPKLFTFRAPPSALTALAAGGVDIASMANNHGLDYGRIGLADSLLAIRSSGYPVVGIGRNAREAYAPHRLTVRGSRVAVIGATQVLDDHLIRSWTATVGQPGLASAKDIARLEVAVRAARRTSDTVVVFLHWGVERMVCPSERQTILARRLVAAGADIVVGSHAHRLQGAGRLNGAFVAYGLGNFAFYSPPGPSAETGVLFVTATGRRIDGYRFAPAYIRDGSPIPLSGADADAAIGRWQLRRSCTGLAP
ncbi:MAG: CapA family protein [Actinomycetota bacterium]